MEITRHNVSSFNIGTFSYNEAPPSSLSSGVLVQEIRSISCLSCGVLVCGECLARRLYLRSEESLS